MGFLARGTAPERVGPHFQNRGRLSRRRVRFQRIFHTWKRQDASTTELDPDTCYKASRLLRPAALDEAIS